MPIEIAQGNLFDQVFDQVPEKQSNDWFRDEHIITTEPVPFKFQLRPDYVYVVLERRTKDKTYQFQLPLQLTPQEAGLLIYQLKGGV